MSIRIAINGFGRIGRPTFRAIFDNHPNLELAAVNDLTDRETLLHLLKYDSLYGIYNKQIDKKIKFFSEKDSEKLPWRDLAIDIVLECSGEFTEIEEVKRHLEAGAKKVIISTASKSKEIP